MKRLVKRAMFGEGGGKVRDIRKGLMAGHRFVIDPATQSNYLLGLYEREILSHVRKAAKGVDVAFDIGTNSGWYGTFFAVQPNIQRVFAFDNDPEPLDMFRENLRVNDIEPEGGKVEIVTKLVGNRDDDGWVRVDELPLEDGQRVLLKIDVEGGEAEVLDGARGVLERPGSRVIIEVHGPQCEKDCLARLSAWGFSPQVVPQGWYRKVMPEVREPDNRWVVAEPKA